MKLTALPSPTRKNELWIEIPELLQMKDARRLKELAKLVKASGETHERANYYTATPARAKKLVALFNGGYEVAPEATGWSCLRHPLRPQLIQISEALEYCEGGIKEHVQEDTRYTRFQKHGLSTYGQNKVLARRILDGFYRASLTIPMICDDYRKETGMNLAPDSVAAQLYTMRKARGAISGR